MRSDARAYLNHPQSPVHLSLHQPIVMDKVQSKFKTTRRDFKYHYLFSPALPRKPTLLFIHGFPSTSYDWYRQINYFQPEGYGLVVPDLLGFGQTEPKSNNPADFLHTAIGQDLLDILDEEGVKNVIAIGHDWGSAIASILSVKHSDRFLGFVFTAVTYYPPSVFPPLDLIFEFQRQRYGRPLMGYWKFFGKDDAARLIEANIDSFLDVVYPADPEVWKTYINLPDALEVFVRQQGRLSRAPYVTPEHYEQIKASLLQGGLSSPLNWYKSNLQGVNNGIRTTVTEEDINIRKPAFMAVAKYDFVCFREFAITEIEKYAKGGLTTVEFDVGHWPQLEKAEEYNEALDRWMMNTFDL
ncbi:Alpha/Beta hydrolase protein [Boletus edulis BED1]|uniref:Alpha/Beta hydrolase protein n=1 Tax=Boletus edulis BED1 TaxID=1328754 RepID=A0AAD4C0J9_BOLED|nr:Alpha/Beta hydrolase protein [Boletus edulis BED1]